MTNNTNLQLKELRQTIFLMELIFNAIDESVVYINKKNEIKWCNRVFDELVDKPHITMLGQNFFDVFDIKKISTSDEKTLNFIDLNIQDNKWTVNECSYIKNDKEIFLQISCIKHVEGPDSLFIIIIRDITEQKKMRLQLEHLAHYDLLTNVPNRLQLMAFLKHDLLKSKRHLRKLAVFFIDIDKFKEINDTYGHAVGDLFLKIFADRLQKAVRAEDLVSRVGGDEFVVIATEITHNIVKKIHEKIKNSLNQPYNISGTVLNNNASIGFSIYPDDGGDVDTLIELADSRMYQEKNQT